MRAGVVAGEVTAGVFCLRPARRSRSRECVRVGVAWLQFKGNGK